MSRQIPTQNIILKFVNSDIFLLNASFSLGAIHYIIQNKSSGISTSWVIYHGVLNSISATFLSIFVPQNMQFIIPLFDTGYVVYHAVNKYKKTRFCTK